MDRRPENGEKILIFKEGPPIALLLDGGNGLGAAVTTGALAASEEDAAETAWAGASAHL